VHLELRVPVAAVFEAERLERMVADGERRQVERQVPPLVAR